MPIKATPKIGDQVSKTSGYPFPGEARSIFTNRAGEIRYVIEATGAEYAGMLHIFNPSQIEVVAEGDPPPPSPHVVGWQTMDTAPKDGSAFVAVDISRYPEIEHAHIYKYDGHPNYWHCRKHGICIRPDYQQRYRWAHLPTLAAATSEGGVYRCLTCDGTGMEGRHSICRDCDETSSLSRSTIPVPRGGIEPDWRLWFVSLRRRFRKLEKAARTVITETDRIHDNEPWPVKYQAPYAAITALRETVAEVGTEYPSPSQDVLGSQALLDVAAERQRQVTVEGWSPAHDEQHTDGSMAQAAAAYALKARSDESHANGVRIRPPYLWPDNWHVSWWKPKDRRRDLVRAAALIIAELERLDRATVANTNTELEE